MSVTHKLLCDYKLIMIKNKNKHPYNIILFVLYFLWFLILLYKHSGLFTVFVFTLKYIPTYYMLYIAVNSAGLVVWNRIFGYYAIIFARFFCHIWWLFKVLQNIKNKSLLFNFYLTPKTHVLDMWSYTNSDVPIP